MLLAWPHCIGKCKIHFDNQFNICLRGMWAENLDKIKKKTSNMWRLINIIDFTSNSAS